MMLRNHKALSSGNNNKSQSKTASDQIYPRPFLPLRPCQSRAGGRPPCFFSHAVNRFLSLALFLCLVFSLPIPALAQKAYRVKDRRLDEISGLAASRTNPGLYYVHNDSGGRSDIYVLNGKGRVVSVLSLPRVKNRDWEDIAVGSGPEPQASYVYVGEIGDNDARYPSICLYRFKEPRLKQPSARKPSRVQVWAVDSLSICFEDGPRDCETLLLDPEGGDVYLVSKRELKVGLYLVKAPLAKDSTNVARRISTLDLAFAVAGDISYQRDRILIKTYGKIYGWPLKSGQSIAEALSEKPATLPYKPEPQGEAACFSSDGRAYLTLSEMKKGKPLYLYSYPVKAKAEK